MTIYEYSKVVVKQLPMYNNLELYPIEESFIINTTKIKKLCTYPLSEHIIYAASFMLTA